MCTLRRLHACLCSELYSVTEHREGILLANIEDVVLAYHILNVNKFSHLVTGSLAWWVDVCQYHLRIVSAVLPASQRRQCCIIFIPVWREKWGGEWPQLYLGKTQAWSILGWRWRMQQQIQCWPAFSFRSCWWLASRTGFLYNLSICFFISSHLSL